jgi:hypothetical protein
VAGEVTGYNDHEPNEAQKTIDAKGAEEFCEPTDVKEAIGKAICQLMPTRIMTRVKRDMRRNMRKPMHLSIRKYAAHLLRINRDEIPELPPYNRNNMLPEDEIKEIIIYSIPKTWVKEMDRQSKDPYNMTIGDIVDFLEGIEMSETHDKSATKVEAKNGNNKKSTKNGDSKKDYGSKKEKYCLIHGKNNTHSSDECKTLQAQVKKSKGDNDNKSKDYKSKGNWKDKSNNSTNNSKKELAAFVKSNAKTLQKELNKLNKKKRSADDSSDDEIMAMDMDLAEFDYSNMTNDELDKIVDEMSV